MQPNSAAPAVNLSAENIHQISLVVRDAEKVARRFSEVFGPSWTFYEFRPREIVAHGKPQAGDCVLKMAIGTCGGYSFKLVQPVSGPSSYGEFLEKQGEGFYSIGLGALGDHDSIVDSLARAGVGIEMQGDVGDGSRFTVLQTLDDLGCRVEFTSVPKTARSSYLRQTRAWLPHAPSIIDMDFPIVAGGRRFIQVGLVVKDEKRVAQRYQELLGIGGWRFLRSPPFSTYVAYGRSLAGTELASAEFGLAGAYLGHTQLELIAPVDLGQGGVHRAFLEKHGNGIQHLMISPKDGDHESVIAALAEAGLPKTLEITFTLAGRIATAAYVGMEHELGGFVLEFFSQRTPS